MDLINKEDILNTINSKESKNKKIEKKKKLNKLVKKKRKSFSSTNEYELELFTHNLHPSFISRAIEYLKKPSRSISENQIVISYLFNLNPFADSIKSILNAKSKDFFSNLSFALKYKFYNKNSMIYRFNEISDKFYLILNGEVDLIVPNEEVVPLTIEEYFNYLLNLRKINEFDVINKVISRNMDKYPMNEKNIDIWIKKAYITIINIKYKMEKFEKEEEKRNEEKNENNENYSENEENETSKNRIIKKSKLLLENISNFSPNKHHIQPKSSKNKILRKSIISTNNNTLNHLPLHLKIIIDNINNNNNNDPIYQIFENEEEKTLVMKLEDKISNVFDYISNPNLKKNFTEKFSSDYYIKKSQPKIMYKNNSNSLLTKKKDVFIISYIKAEVKKKGSQFGEILGDMMSNNDDNKRIETVICKKDCEILYLNKEMYNEYIKKISEKLRREKLKYLLDIYLLKTKNKNNFIKNFSGYFVKKIIKYNEYIYTENKYINNINHTNNNNFNKNNLNNNETENNNNNYFENNHYIYFIVKGNFETKCKKSLNEIDMILGIDKNNNELKKLKEYYEHKIFKLLKFGDDDIIGLGDCIYNNRYIFDLICVSSEAIVYEINFMFFKALFNSDKIIKEKVKKIQNKKIDILIKSLEKIRDSKINLIKDKYSQFQFDNLEFNNNKNNNNNFNLFNSQKNNKTKAKIKINNSLLPNIIKKNNNKLDNKNNEIINKNFLSNSLNKIDFNNNKINNNNINNKRQLTDTNLININIKENNNKFNNENQKNNFDVKFRHKIFEENKKNFYIDINNYNKKKNIYLNYNNINLNEDYYNPLIYDDFDKNFNTLTYLNFNSFSSRNYSNNKNNNYKIRLTETPKIKTNKKINDNFNNNNNNYKIIKIKLKNIYNKKYKKLFKTLKNI